MTENNNPSQDISLLEELIKSLRSKVVELTLENIDLKAIIANKEKLEKEASSS